MMNKNSKNILLILVIFSFIFLPLSHWEVPKVWAYLVFVDLLVVKTLFYYLRKKIHIKTQKVQAKTIILAFLVVAIISSIFGVDVGKSITGNYYRLDGLVTLIHLVGYSIIISFLYRKKWKAPLSISIFSAAVISSIWDNFGQINFLVGFILVSLPFGIYLFEKNKNKYARSLILLGMAVVFIKIIFASSYVGVLGLLLVFMFYLYLKQRRYMHILVPISLLTLSLTVFLWYKDIQSHEEFVAESRVRIYRNVFFGSLKKPLLGYGYSNVDYAFNSITWPIKFKDDVYVDNAHMLFLGILAQTGIVGLVIYVYFVFLLLKNLYSRKTKWADALLLSLLMHLLYASTNVTSISQEFIFWTVTGISFALPRKLKG